MRRKINSNSTFKVIKNLPLEVPFERVENWIHQHQLDVIKERKLLPYFLAKWLYRRSEN